MTPEAPRGPAQQILVVDDDAAVQGAVVRVLEQQGHHVTIAANGVAALRVLATSPVDIVITDLIMPDMEGLELLRHLQAMPVPPKVIAMSGGGSSGAVDYLPMAAMLGAVSTLQKPFTPEQLAAAIDQARGAP